MMKMEISQVSNDQLIVKGKRTKRARASSSTSSSIGGGELYNSSSTTSSGISTSREEDEDMAKCLILLARGGSPEIIKGAPEKKFSSRKFTEMATTTNGKVGIYVYECKTCNRTFPSFQALGGHRASHKKPKPTTYHDVQKKSPSPDGHKEEEEEDDQLISRVNYTITLPPSTQVHDQNKPKFHECSICGSEFASGQALGGHMRRHRQAPSARAGTSTDNDSGEKPKNMLALDLNLPAPPEDDKFHQPRLVFSGAALVDCHY